MRGDGKGHPVRLDVTGTVTTITQHTSGRHTVNVEAAPRATAAKIVGACTLFLPAGSELPRIDDEVTIAFSFAPRNE